MVTGDSKPCPIWHGFLFDYSYIKIYNMPKSPGGKMQIKYDQPKELILHVVIIPPPPHPGFKAPDSRRKPEYKITGGAKVEPDFHRLSPQPSQT
jgi:hypothetical protein